MAIVEKRVNELKQNEDNPRYITSEKFDLLVQSVKSFPEMLKARPIVVDENNVILGGNMRYRACVHAGMKTIPVYQISPKDPGIKKTLKERGVTYDVLKAEFVIKDNASYGAWDWDVLANNFTTEDLKGWGLDIWQNEEIDDYNHRANESDEDYLDKYLNKDTGVLKISFLQDDYKDVVRRLDAVQLAEDLETHSETLILLLQHYEDSRAEKS